jgi:hypothetical protein
MRHSTQTTTITVLLAIALATSALGASASLSAADISIEPVTPTVSGPAESVIAEVPVASTSGPTARDRVLATLSNVRSKSKAAAVLVIPSAQMKPEDTTALIEDMTIMSRIFEKKLADQHLIPSSRMFLYTDSADPFKRYFARGNRTTEAIYVEGFGALFLMNVDFPLSPPPQGEADIPDDGTDRVWAAMREHMYRPEDSRRSRKQEQKEQYDAEKIDDLQRTLIKGLKHAANIRGLKAQESVTIMVRGSDITVPLTKNESALAAEYRRMTGELTTVQPTFLTIRAKKPDIDSFAKNELDYNQFRQRIQTLAY